MDEIRKPGKWLDEEPTEDERKELMELFSALVDLKEEKDPNVIIEKTSPYLNAFMHFIYTISKENMGLEATDEGVRYKGTSVYFDIVGHTINFIIDKFKLPSLIQEQEAAKTKELPDVLVHKLENIDFPVDKVNSKIWKMFDNTNGQYKINFNVSKRGNSRQIAVVYSLDFNDLPNDMVISRKLEIYDKRVCLAIAALYNDGCEFMSVSQIYDSMGNKGRPGASDIKKINDSITKMNGATLSLNNKAEADAYNYDYFEYDGKLLQMERIKGIVKGQVSETVIHVFREPAIVTFARQRKQITTISKKLLNSPLSKTNANMELEDYLIERISHMKKRKIRNKMLFTTIYENTHISSVKQKQRAPEKIKKLLEHYKANNFIKGYRMERDGVTIIC